MEKYLNKQTQNYWIIVICSLILTVFLPFAGSVAGLAWVFPTTVAGWIVYIVLKAAATGLNMMIFHHFVLQAKVNIKDDPRFLEAEKLLQNFLTDYIPISPKQFFKKQYRKKGSTLIITTLLSTICITQAMLTFDPISFVVHLLAVVFAIIFGVQTMREDEDFWTVDYLKYAKYVVEKGVKDEPKKAMACNKDKDKAIVHEGIPDRPDSGGTTLLEPLDNSSDIVNIQSVDVESSSDSVLILGVSTTGDPNTDSIHINDTCNQNET